MGKSENIRLKLRAYPMRRPSDSSRSSNEYDTNSRREASLDNQVDSRKCNAPSYSSVPLQKVKTKFAVTSQKEMNWFADSIWWLHSSGIKIIAFKIVVFPEKVQRVKHHLNSCIGRSN